MVLASLRFATAAAILISLLATKTFVFAASSSDAADEIQLRRELQVQGNLFTERVDHCRKVSDNLFQTISVRSVFSRLAQRRRGDVPGKCGAVCAVACEHKPCFDDFQAVNNNTCECNTATTSRCGEGATCNVVSVGNEACACPVGFQINATSGGCIDIDECETKGICSRPLTCANTIGSYTCNCPRGYTASNTDPSSNDTTCVDIDECATQPSVCPTSICANTVGSYTCGRCLPGFKGNPPSVPCTDVNECTANATICSANGSCKNTVGSYDCECKAGYQFVNGTCLDRDECVENTASCDLAVSRCRNTNGNFTCRCLPGFKGNPPAVPCTDINECDLNANLCLPSGLCTNTPGSYECTCTVGFTFMNTTGKCVDVDECETDPNLCDLSVSRCRNTEGSFACRCIDGFNATADGKCVQVFKFDVYQPCVEVFDCLNGLECAVKSRSETTSKICCAPGSVTPCLGGDKRCCTGAYTEGQRCPSKLDVDCRNGLQCGWRGFLDTTFVCCDRTVPIFGGNKVCRF